jgi:hypothetical protein
MSGSKTSLDVLEQLVRIDQLLADIALKEQTVRQGKVVLIAAVTGAASGLLAAVFAGVKLFLGP